MFLIDTLTKKHGTLNCLAQIITKKDAANPLLKLRVYIKNATGIGKDDLIATIGIDGMAKIKQARQMFR